MDYGKMDDGSGDVSMKLDKLKELKNKIYELMASGQSGDAIMEEVQEAVSGESKESPSKEKAEPEHDMESMGEDDPMKKLAEMKKAYFKPKAKANRPGTGSFIAVASEKMPFKSSGKPKFGGKMGK
jgi:hypothetical protein